MKTDGNWGSDIEINKMAELLESNIICYTEESEEYKLKGVYYGTEDYTNCILLDFINNNHFQILFPKSYKSPNVPIPINGNYLKKFQK